MTFDELNERDAWRALVWIIRAADLYFRDPKGPGSRPRWRWVDGQFVTHPVREFRAGLMCRELRMWAEAVRAVHPDLALPELPASVGLDEDVKLIGLWARTALKGLVDQLAKPKSMTPPGAGPFSCSDLAIVYRVSPDALRKRLDKFRGENKSCAVENADRRPRESQWLYRLPDVLPVIEALKSSSTYPAEKKSS